MWELSFSLKVLILELLSDQLSNLLTPHLISDIIFLINKIFTEENKQLEDRIVCPMMCHGVMVKEVLGH